MRRKEKLLTDQQIINEMLDSAEICHVSINDEKAPYTFVVNYAYKDGKIYFHSAIAGRKIDLLKINNQVCFNIEGNYEIVKAKKACAWSARYRSIIGYGSVCIENSDEIKIKGLDLIMKKYGAEGKQEYAIGALKNTAMLVITIDELSAKQSGNWE